MKLTFSILSIILLHSIISAQIFSFNAVTHEDKDYLVALSGMVEYSNTGVDLMLFNESQGKAEVTGIYLLKPNNFEPILRDYIEGWKQTDSFKNGVDSGIGFGKLNFTDYFGVVSETPDNTGLGMFESMRFSWEYNAEEYTDFNPSSENPHLLVRWQSLENSDSAKGYAFFYIDSTIVTPVPEPKHIAVTSVFFLLIILFFRRK